MKNGIRIIYSKSELMSLLRSIDDEEKNFIRLSDYDHVDAIRVDERSKFLAKMPFNNAQYLYVDNGEIVISDSFDAYKKKVSNQVRTGKDFFKAFSKLNLKNVLDDEILEEFSYEHSSYSKYDNYDDYDNLHSINTSGTYRSCLGEDSDDDLDFEINPYTDKYTLGGM